MAEDYIFLQEIFEQPDAIQRTLDRSGADTEHIARQIASHIQRVQLVGCGDPLFLSQAVKYAFRYYANLPAYAVDGLEFTLYNEQDLNPDTLLIGISQSGKTLQVREALLMAKRAGAMSIAVSNMANGPIVKLGDYALLSHAGLSTSFPTKTTTCLLTILIRLAVALGRARGYLSSEQYQDALTTLAYVPQWAHEALTLHDELRAIAQQFAQADFFRFVGTGPGFATALLGAAKLKETSQTRAEANQLEEVIHLHAFTVRPSDPIFFLTPGGKANTRAVEIAAFARKHGAVCHAVVSPGSGQTWRDAGLSATEINPSVEWLTPIIHIIPLQFFAYHLSLAKGRNPDRPIGYDEVGLQRLIYSDLLEGWFIS